MPRFYNTTTIEDMAIAYGQQSFSGMIHIVPVIIRLDTELTKAQERIQELTKERDKLQKQLYSLC